MRRKIFSCLFCLFLPACATTEPTVVTKTVNVLPPVSEVWMEPCVEPVVPRGKNVTENQLVTYIANLWSAYKACDIKHRAIVDSFQKFEKTLTDE